MTAQSLAVPAYIWVLHMNIVVKIKISKSFETPLFGLKWCLTVSTTYLRNDKTIFREKISSCVLKSIVFWCFCLIRVTLKDRTDAFFVFSNVFARISKRRAKYRGVALIRTVLICPIGLICSVFREKPLI